MSEAPCAKGEMLKYVIRIANQLQDYKNLVRDMRLPLVLITTSDTPGIGCSIEPNPVKKARRSLWLSHRTESPGIPKAVANYRVSMIYSYVNHFSCLQI